MKIEHRIGIIFLFLALWVGDVAYQNPLVASLENGRAIALAASTVFLLIGTLLLLFAGGKEGQE